MHGFSTALNGAASPRLPTPDAALKYRGILSRNQSCPDRASPTCRDTEGASEERIQARVEKAKGSRARRFAAGWACHPRRMGAQAGAGQQKKGGRDPPHFSRLFEMNWSTTAPQRARGSLAGILSAFNGGSPWLETVCTCGVVPVNTPPRKEVDFLAIEDLGWVECSRGSPFMTTVDPGRVI